VVDRSGHERMKAATNARLKLPAIKRLKVRAGPEYCDAKGVRSTAEDRNAM
jgi:hypothetical protein